MLQELGNTTYSGNNEALLILSKCYEKGTCVEKNANKAFELLTKAADKNNQTACFLLGEKYYLGNGVSKDLDKSANYLQKGIRMEERSIDNVGYKYYYMLGKILVSKSDRGCISYFEDAFHCSDPKRYEAAIELGNLYYEGKVVEKNEGEAAEYYWLAYKDGKLEEGKRLFEKYQLKDKLIKYLNEKKTEGKRYDEYVEEMIQSLNK
jgi:TPR repeat protein